MKKKLLAAGVAATLGMMSGVASAALSVSEGGVGAINLVPYYSVQGGNATLISITNVDQTNGKVVKVRFRGAEWSDDVFDFQIFMSPGDVWTGAVSLNGTVPAMETSDSSCTLPASVNQNFPTFRLDPAAAPAGALEGYIEVITMADIVPGSNIDDAINHPANGQPLCRTDGGLSQAVLEALVEDNPQNPGGNAADGMAAPGNSLMTFTTIINVNDAKAISANATAVQSDNLQKQYYRQSNDRIPAPATAGETDLTELTAVTADRIFYATGVPLGTDLPLFQFDLPDLSTPLDADVGLVLAADFRDALAVLLQKGTIFAEFETSAALNAATDIVLSQPTRRYFYEYAAAAAPGDRTFSATAGASGTDWDVTGEAGSPYESLDGATNTVPLGIATFFDREENTLTTASDIVISPTPPSAVTTFSLGGEVSVVAINNGSVPTGALTASLTAQDFSAENNSGSTFENGWAMLDTTSTCVAAGAFTTCDLPIIGYSAISVFNSAIGLDGATYTITLPLRYPTALTNF